MVAMRTVSDKCPVYFYLIYEASVEVADDEINKSDLTSVCS